MIGFAAAAVGIQIVIELAYGLRMSTACTFGAPSPCLFNAESERSESRRTQWPGRRSKVPSGNDLDLALCFDLLGPSTELSVTRLFRRGVSFKSSESYPLA